MHVTLVHVYVKTEHVAAFIEATHANHRASVMESGNRRFDILRAHDDTTHFVLYEAYHDAAAAAAHKQTQHYLAWRERVAPWMARPRAAQVFDGLFPHG